MKSFITSVVLVVFSSGVFAEGVLSEKGFIGLADDGQSMYFCAVHKHQEETPTGLGMRCMHWDIEDIRATSVECIAFPDKSNMKVLPRADVQCGGI